MKNDKKPCSTCKHPFGKHFGVGCSFPGCKCTAYKGA